VRQLLCTAGNIYLLLIFARIVLSWFPLSPDSPFAAIYSFLYSATEPVLGPVRRLIPPVALGGMALDLSPIIVLLTMQIVVLPFVC
jgi:YggT family protein